ncbi:CpaF family protein [Bacillus cereus]|uniref:CpaF family protein n=1 Tax=Bacillus cereus TaxID=1396 RepID=UPI000B4B57A7|nr:CpaF family protein [Bacillus cereus]
MSDFFNRMVNNNIETENNSREVEVQKLKDVVQKKLPNYIDNQVIFGISDKQQIETIKNHMRHIIHQTGTFLRNYEIDQLVESFVLEITSLGKLSALMEDPTITEIMINAHDEIWVDRSGTKQMTDITYANEQEVLELAQRIARNVGRLIDVQHPYVDARLPDGSRVNIIIPPVARKGVTITIRKFSKEKLGIEDLVKFNSLTPEMARFLRNLVFAKCNIIVSGGTGSGKTTTLNVISNFVPDDERIITIEDSAELQLSNAHFVSLETKDANAEGKGRVTIQDLVKNSLRMYPDRIILGEVRDHTAYDLLQAMNTGHEGSMATIHANNPDECISRMASLILERGQQMEVRQVRRDIGHSLDIVVQINKMRDKKRRIECISEVIVTDDGVVKTVPIYEFKVEGLTEDNKIVGEYVRTDYTPSVNLLYKFKQNGIPTNGF